MINDGYSARIELRWLAENAVTSIEPILDESF